ncbi:hypothetical protein [Brucella pituitosa]|uniref:hypothetical protein n=1 Tax=Brucella pituitosa TaxID=571256 RepID=UPI0009A216CC|nr:hypothetical protein [Brucella pituitosa]
METIGCAAWRVLKKAHQAATEKTKKSKGNQATEAEASLRNSAKASACVERLTTVPCSQRISQLPS